MTLPGSLQGWTASGINAPSSEYAGDGSTWYGVTMKRDGGIYYCVWREAPAGVYELKWNGPRGLHRATMHAQLNGKLIVTAYAGEGDGSASERIDVTGYVPLPIPLPDLSALRATVDGLLGSISTQSARSDNIVDMITILSSRVTAVEQSDGGGVGLDAADRKALDWLIALKELL